MRRIDFRHNCILVVFFVLTTQPHQWVQFKQLREQMNPPKNGHSLNKETIHFVLSHIMISGRALATYNTISIAARTGTPEQNWILTKLE